MPARAGGAGGAETPVGADDWTRVITVTLSRAAGATGPNANPSANPTKAGPADVPPASGWSWATRAASWEAVSTSAL